MSQRDATWTPPSEQAQHLQNATEICRRVAAGDLEARILFASEAGDFAPLACAINDLLDRVDGFVREATGCLAHVAQNEFYRHVLEAGMPGLFRHAARTMNAATDAMGERSRELDAIRERNLSMATQLEQMVMAVASSVATSSEELQGAAQRLAGAAERTTRTAADLVAASSNAEDNVQTVAAAVEELSASARQVNDHMDASVAAVQEVCADARAATRCVESLQDSAQKIDAFTGIISSVASQTTLLALNAAIEAARAGEAGKGFGVVATEVKVLASEATTATRDIDAHVATIRTEVDGTRRAIQTIQTRSANMDRIAEEVAAAVREQSLATSQIAQNVEQAARESGTVAVGAQTIAETASETRAAADGVLASAASLSEQAAALREEMRGFLGRFREAT